MKYKYKNRDIVEIIYSDDFCSSAKEELKELGSPYIVTIRGREMFQDDTGMRISYYMEELEIWYYEESLKEPDKISRFELLDL